MNTLKGSNRLATRLQRVNIDAGLLLQLTSQLEAYAELRGNLKLAERHIAELNTDLAEIRQKLGML